ncbi:MAG: helix-turn-helix transcriptional regulator [Roseibium sp.]|uniref:helix-turn-helix domain-containing protein n=1 Tax=Roseibium sp. TaxID=1936156 RepID=UPI001B1062F4|nr:AraC family transcriptional regulator [Roseibium sp.]MBO6891172.1 helix-turn-helix transcriptional regulator [Roseibium sp.]MBO6928787.1 helix-turn-helix transcriptional regulator [Roseibium sp.]
MISIPVSFLLACLFLLLGLIMVSWRSLPPLSRMLFLLAFALMACEAVLVGMRFAFNIYDLLFLQRALPVWIAPALYVSFVALTVSKEATWRQIRINFGISAVLTTAMFLPIPFGGYIDLLIAASFATYTALLFRLWRRGADQFSQAPTRLSEVLLKLLGLAVTVMLATLLVDVFIAILFANEMAGSAAVTISVVSLLFLIATLALLAESLRLQARRGRRAVETPQANDPVSEDLVERARKVLAEKSLFRDPGLTLTRLARRVGVPDRDLSQAINQATGMNVSQFVNQVRLAEAARLLTSTDEPVAKIMEQVGFLTRSNFYREFRKVYGEAPASFRKKLSLRPAEIPDR